MFITENGAAYRRSGGQCRVEDEARRQYLETHVRAAGDAIECGVDLRGIFSASTARQFDGPPGRKALRPYYVDYATQARIAKSSATWYAQLTAPAIAARIHSGRQTRRRWR